MDKDGIKKHLTHLTQHAQTGGAGQMENTQTMAHVGLISLELSEEITKLKNTILALDKQNEKLEKTNIRLQWIMVFLTIATTILAVVTLFR